MKRIVISSILCTFLLIMGEIVNIQAYSGRETTTIGYDGTNAPFEMKIIGEQNIIKGTAGHPYHLYADGNEISCIWNIKNASSKNTRIDAGGFLNIGVDETADEVEIIGYSTVNPNRYAVYKVKLTEKTYTVINVKKKNDVTMLYGTTKKQLMNMQEKINGFEVTIKTNENKTYVITVDRTIISLEEEAIQSNGIIREGNIKVNYDLILPFLQIDYDGTVYTDNGRKTNITGEAVTDIMVEIKKNQTSSDMLLSRDGTLIKEAVETDDGIDMNRYIMGILIIPLIAALMIINRKKQDKEKYI